MPARASRLGCTGLGRAGGAGWAGREAAGSAGVGQLPPAAASRQQGELGTWLISYSSRLSPGHLSPGPTVPASEAKAC